MYLSVLSIKNFRSFDEDGVTIKFREGLTAIVGENDSGKTAIIDALRFLLSTTDQEWLRFTLDDFYQSSVNGCSSSEIQISATFENLTLADKSGFAEYLTYGANKGDEPTFQITLTAKQNGRKAGRVTIFTETRSGLNAEGPTLDNRTRTLLAATYLRPLRDAEDELSSGKNSRLSMVLYALGGVGDGELFDPIQDETKSFDAERISKLSLLGLGDYFNKLIENHGHITKGSSKVSEHLEAMQLSGDLLNSSISVSSNGSDSTRLRQLLEKLNLNLSNASGRMGLGSNNILFMACELLLLADEQDSFPMLLIEEPEAHIHAQRQIRLINYLQSIASKTRADGQKPQIIITTHSPNLASEISIDNLVIVKSGSAFSMCQEQTKLEQSDYRFLSRFLDVTKANLFFARSVMIVEGDAENILIPTLAKSVGRDFTKHGVSIVNVGGVGLRRYAKIFLRKNVEEDGEIAIPVACVTDLDVMPNCGPEITKKVKRDEDWPQTTGSQPRKWRAKSDFKDNELEEFKNKIRNKAHEQNVSSYVAEEWTLEYDLAHFNNNALAKEVFSAAKLAIWDENESYSNKNYEEKISIATSEYSALIIEVETIVKERSWSKSEVLASSVYAQFVTGSKASKSIAAQYLAKILEDKFSALSPKQVEQLLPAYLMEAIKYVTPDTPHY